jgi:hypothetical protein
VPIIECSCDKEDAGAAGRSEDEELHDISLSLRGRGDEFA